MKIIIRSVLFIACGTLTQESSARMLRDVHYAGPVDSAASQAVVAQGDARIGVSGGMGVSYISAQDVVDLVNASGGVVTERVPEFKAGAEFFGAVTVPVSTGWGLKFEYAYLICSYNPTTQSTAVTEFTVAAHMPTILAQYVLVDGVTYNVKAGAGLGYHAGSLTVKYFSVDDRFTAKGLGAEIDLEANTAFGESFFGYLGGTLRWDFMGDLTNDVGRSPSLIAGSAVPTLHFFSVGARLGFTYYL